MIQRVCVAALALWLTLAGPAASQSAQSGVPQRSPISANDLLLCWHIDLNAEDGVPPCGLAYDRRPLLSFPSQLAGANRVGIVVVRIALNEDGTQREIMLAARAGDPDFGDAVARSIREWRVRAADRGACTAHQVAFIPINFVLAQRN